MNYAQKVKVQVWDQMENKKNGENICSSVEFSGFPYHEDKKEASLNSYRFKDNI